MDGTVLVAPQAGTVVSVAGAAGSVVSGSGGSSGSGSSGSSGASGSSGSGSGGSATGSSSGGSGSASSGSASSGSSGSSAGTSSGFVVIADLAAMTVTADLAEADVATVKVGQPAAVTFPATQLTAAGRVTDVSLVASTSNNVVQYPVTVTLDGVPDGVRLGATASLSITTASVQDVLVVPSSALTTIGTRHAATVLRNGQQSVVPVQTGVAGDAGTEVTAGLVAGDVVVIPTSASGSTGGSGFPRLGGGLGVGGAGR
jgi:hypothetical protein